MSICEYFHFARQYNQFILAFYCWSLAGNQRQAALPSAGSGRTAQLINLLRVCSLVADVGIAGLSCCRSIFKESEAWVHLLALLPVERVVYYPNL